MNILVLTTRNIYGNSGEYSLMSAKDKELKKRNIHLYYYSFRRNFNFPIPNELDIVRQESTFSIIFRKKIILQNIISIIKEKNIKIIILSGNWILFLYKKLKILKQEYNIKFSYDYQGAIEEVKEYKLFKQNKLLSNFLFNRLKNYEDKILNLIDGIEAVSYNGVKHLQKVYSPTNNYKTVIIHCGIENPISKNQYDEYRKIYRKKYQLKDDELSCTYAGGIKPWQNIDKIIKLANATEDIKFFIYTSPKNQKKLQDLYKITKNIYFDFLPHTELNKALCAFDYGILLRNEDVTNYVAFPNKYSDYINARLKVIVKNTDIGYYPEEKERQNIIVKNINNTNEDITQEIYESYIYDLTYSYMITRLEKFYKEIISNNDN